MRVLDLIWKKREGMALSEAEIEELISGFVSGEIPDYQMSALCMAVFFQGMTFEECTALTLAMARSGETIDLSAISGVKVDKHSTGGVGDKTSLVLLPLVAACGVPVAKMSGRGLGHTGGTVDKLEAIPGVTTSLSRERFIGQVQEIGVALAGQTGNLVPADKKLYALRDVTATVESIPLIASSIISKKLAAGADAVVLDVKYGDGAFMSQYDRALELAKTMVEIGTRAGRKMMAVLSDMNQPLGAAIGNSLEVQEAVTTLAYNGPADLTELCLTLAGYMLWMGDQAVSPEFGTEKARQALSSGAALAKFRQLIVAQGGDPAYIDHPDRLASAPIQYQIHAPQHGWIQQIDCRALGVAAMHLGAGRAKLGDPIQPEVGMLLKAKVGQYVEKGQPLAEVHASSESDLSQVWKEVEDCFHLSESPVVPLPLIASVVQPETNKR